MGWIAGGKCSSEHGLCKLLAVDPQPARAIDLAAVLEPTLHVGLHKILRHAKTDGNPWVVLERGSLGPSEELGALLEVRLLLCGVELDFKSGIVVFAVVVSAVVTQQIEKIAGIVEIGEPRRRS